MKKIIALILCLAIVLTIVSCFAACDKQPKRITMSNVKVGFIFLNGAESTYDKNFMDAAKEMQKKMGLKDSQIVFRDNIPESNLCYETAVELAEQGCDIVFANSFSHENFLIKAAKEYPNVQFCHASGTQAHIVNLPNFHNAFASIYEGRYLTGVVAGLKLKEMINNKQISPAEAVLGYIGAYPYPEVKSGYTAFYLGAKSVCPSVTMKVTFTNSWFELIKEQRGAANLINLGCKVISQHADSMGAPTVCEEKGVPNVSYNGGLVSEFPKSHLVSTKINWAPYFEYMINCVVNGELIKTDWTGNIQSGSVVLTDINENVAASGTQDKIESVKESLLHEEIFVFDTSTFTVNGNELTEYFASVSGLVGDTQVISDGIFYESYYRSAPYFDIDIDGITIIEDVK